MLCKGKESASRGLQAGWQKQARGRGIHRGTCWGSRWRHGSDMQRWRSYRRAVLTFGQWRRHSEVRYRLASSMNGLSRRYEGQDSKYRKYEVCRLEAYEEERRRLKPWSRRTLFVEIPPPPTQPRRASTGPRGRVFKRANQMRYISCEPDVSSSSQPL